MQHIVQATPTAVRDCALYLYGFVHHPTSPCITPHPYVSPHHASPHQTPPTSPLNTPPQAQATPQHVATLLLNLAKLRIPLPQPALDTCLETTIQHTHDVHDLSLVCYSTAMMLADNPTALPTIRPTLERLLGKIQGQEEALNVDDGRQLLSLHYLCCMIEDKYASLLGAAGGWEEQPGGRACQHAGGDADDNSNSKQDGIVVVEQNNTTTSTQSTLPDDTTGILPPGSPLLQRCRDLVHSIPPVPLNTLQSDLAATAAHVPGVAHVETGWAPLDGIVRMAVVCRMEGGAGYGLHTNWPRFCFRNAKEVDGPANVRRELLQWQGVQVVRVNRAMYMGLEGEEARVDKLRKMLSYAAAAGGEEA